MLRALLIPTLFLLFILPSVYADSISNASVILDEIAESKSRVEPIVYNAEAWSSQGVAAFGGRVRYMQHMFYSSGYGYLAENVSGLLYTIEGLPQVSFSYLFNASLLNAYYSILAMSNELSPDRYMYLKLDVKPLAWTTGVSYVSLLWGVKAYNASAGQWADESVYLFTLNTRINETYLLNINIVPCFYEYQSSLIFGFAISIMVEGNRYYSVSVGDIAYNFIPLANKTNIELASALSRLYRWRVWVGAGVSSVLGNNIYKDMVWTQANPVEITFNYEIRAPTAFAVKVNADKLRDKFLSGGLPVYTGPVFKTEVYEKDNVGVLMTASVPLGLSVLAGVFMKKFRMPAFLVGLGVSVLFNIMLYLIFGNIAFIMLMIVGLLITLGGGKA